MSDLTKILLLVLMSQQRIIGVGVDICKVSRIAQLMARSDYARKRFLTGCFHATEQEEYGKKASEEV